MPTALGAAASATSHWQYRSVPRSAVRAGIGAGWRAVPAAEVGTTNTRSGLTYRLQPPPSANGRAMGPLAVREPPNGRNASEPVRALARVTAKLVEPSTTWP